MDKSMWQTFGAFDLLHSSHMWIQAILFRGKHSTSMQTGIVFQDPDFAGDFEDSKSTSGGILCIFGSHTFVPRSLMCKQFYRSWSNLSQCRCTHGWDSRSRSFGFCDWSISFLTKPNQQNQWCKRATGNLSANTHQTCENKFQPRTPIAIWSTLSRFIKRNTFWFQCYVVCLWGQWSRD